MKLKSVILSFLCLASILLAGMEMTIAENGVAKAGILVPENTKPVVRLAAEELAFYLKKITGAEFTIDTASKFQTNFKLGFGDPEGLEDEEFIIRTNDNDIEIFGHDSGDKFSWFEFYYYCSRKGTLQGVYYFLEQLGVRWPAPGMDHIPEQKKLVLKPLDIRFKPYFKDRLIGSYGYRFVGLEPDSYEYCNSNSEAMRWFMRIGESPRHVVMGCHSEHSLGLYKDPEWKSDETRLQLTIKGERHPNYSCWTHPDVKHIWLKAADAYFSGKTAYETGFKYAVTYNRPWPYPFYAKDEFMIDPWDNVPTNDGRCRCERCQEYRKKHPCLDDTEMLWDVLSYVAENVHKKHPGCYISTLIYPPKTQIPTRELPPNIRVRVCLAGPKICLDPVNFEKEFQRIQAWRRITGNKVPLWAYHCISFNNTMPSLVETYPHLIQKYLQALKGVGEGMFLETHSQTFTQRLLDTYIAHRLMRNPDLDLEKELDEYFRVLYGPAHQEARQFHAELERLFADFWHKTVPVGQESSAVAPWKSNDYDMKKKLWILTYTPEKLDELGKLVAAMEKKAAGTRYAKAVRLLRKYIYDGLVFQRNLVFGKEETRRKIKLAAGRIASDIEPTEEHWKNAPVNRLVPSKLFCDKLKANGCFQLLSDGKTLFFRALLDEYKIDKTLFQPDLKNGDKTIWKDNDIEIFMTSMKDNFTWQVLVNDRGVWSSTLRKNAKSSSDFEWVQMPDCKVTVEREPKRWTIQASFPLKTLNPSGGEFRMNVIRSRQIKGEAAEYSTFSPLAVKYHWAEPANFATVSFSE